MGIDEAIHLLKSILKEYFNRFAQDELNKIQSICEKLLVLFFKSRDSDEEIEFQNEKAALAECLSKVKFTLINEGESYRNIGKIIKVITE